MGKQDFFGQKHPANPSGRTFYHTLCNQARQIRLGRGGNVLPRVPAGLYLLVFGLGPQSPPNSCLFTRRRQKPRANRPTGQRGFCPAPKETGGEAAHGKSPSRRGGGWGGGGRRLERFRSDRRKWWPPQLGAGCSWDPPLVNRGKSMLTEKGDDRTMGPAMGPVFWLKMGWLPAGP